MRKKIIAGNWKMHKNADEARALVKELVQLKVDHEKTHVILFPPQVYLSEFSLLKTKDVSIGAQNSYPKNEGAFTGEVSAYMLSSLGIGFCLVGHSERRKYFNESDADCLAKIKSLIENRITPIFCVGEELSVRESEHHFGFVRDQLYEVFDGMEISDIHKLVIAYEPIWAIGTGKTATTQEASEMHSFIRKLIVDRFGETAAQKVYILYGGSVNENNAKELMASKDIDGVLVGGASLDGKAFEEIVLQV